MIIFRLSAAAAIAACFTAAPLAAQTLTLERALLQAERNAFGNRVAEAEAAAQAASQTRTLAGILPTLSFEGGFTRTSDPIGAFGTALRQRRITQQDFDPSRLNRPAPVSNYVGAVVLQQPLFNADAHIARRAAARATDAADAALQWARVGTRVEVVRAYFGATLAAEKAATLEVAHEAARGHVAQAAKMVGAGLATRSDELLADVRAGEIEAQLLEERAGAVLAVRQLALVIGAPAESLSVPGVLPPVATVAQLLASDPGSAPPVRADVGQAQLGAQAARLDVQRARSLYLPRINGFARFDWNSEQRMYAGEENWSVGVMASWTPFAGASELAEQQAAAGRNEAAAAMLDAARARASLEAESAASARSIARMRLDIAVRAAAQSGEAHRIIARKYDGGLATLLELLDAAAVQTQSELALAHARYAGIVAEAEWRRALGLDPADIAHLLTRTLPGVD